MKTEKQSNKRTVAGIVIAIVLAVGLTLCVPSLYASVTAMPLRITVFFSVQVALFAIALFANRIIEKKPFSDLGFTKEGLSSQFIWAGVLLVGLSVVFIGIPFLFGIRDIFPARDNLLFAIPYRLVFVGFAEETLFRGYLMKAIQKLIKSKIATALLSSVLFGAWHFILSGDILQVIFTTIIGLIFAIPVLYSKKCTVLSTSLAHGAYDALLAVLSWI